MDYICVNQLRDVNKKLIIYFIVISSSFIKTFAQDTDSLILYRGQVISEQRGYPIALAHVISLQRKRGVIADTTGQFEIWTTENDTLNISAIGFSFLEHPVNYKKDTFVEIKLKHRSYEIPEISITYLGTYKDFEYKVLNLDLPEIKLNEQVSSIFKHVEAPPMVVEPTVTSPASLIYVMFSKEAKDIKKYLELEKEGKVKDKVRERYNEHIIKNITGLETVEARKFMEFCNFQDKYILSISDYNLYNEIMLRYNAYKKTGQDSLNLE